MSKIKFTLLLIGSLLIGNTDLQAAKKHIVETKETKADVQSSDVDDSSKTDSAEGDKPITKKEFDALNAEVAILRDQTARQLDRTIANSQRSLKISGTLQNRYTAVTSSNIPQVSNGFTVNAAILSLTGALKKDYEEGRNLTYVLSTLGSAPTYNVQPLDVYLQYSILQTLDPEQATLNVQFGQNKKPFGLEPQVGEDKTPAANVATFAGGGGLNLAARDIGITFRGDLLPFYDGGFNYRVPLIEYALGLYNGSGPNASDTNKSKDVVARINFNAPVDWNSDFRGLTIGSSFYTGKKDLTLANGTAITGGTGGASKVRYGQDISYVASPIGFTAEYAVGRDENALSGTSLSNAVKATTESRGYTVTLFYQWGEQFVKAYRNQDRIDDWWPKTYQPFIRFDRWDPNTALSNNESTIVTYGFNFFFAETTKLQLNYIVSDIKSTNTKQNQFVAQFQYGF